MPLQIFQVIFDRASATYATGETVTGKIALGIDHPKVVRGMHVEVKGEGRVHWVNRDKRELIPIHTNSETYLNLNFDILGTQTFNSRTEIKEGYHEYRFSYPLPKNIPSTFKDTIGSVAYTMKVVIDRPWKFNHVHESTFTVISPLNLTDYDEQCVPIDEDDQVNFYGFCCCCHQGALNLEIKVPTTGYIPGQTIYTTINYENGSRSVEMTKVRAQLKQKVKYHAQFPLRKVKKMEYVVKSTKLYPPFHKKGQVVLDLLISPTPPSYMQHCNIIDVKYELELTINVTGSHFCIDKSYPILIGTTDINQMTEHLSLSFPLTVAGEQLPLPVATELLSALVTTSELYASPDGHVKTHTFEPSTHHDHGPSTHHGYEPSTHYGYKLSTHHDCEPSND
ncbi:arrestin domain-containing protein 17-like [Megachile rotundata]|uniref:arrestin domain-containing protein 17-like n=1 Tax=Megachile rotundata TaxID=143995 RepID=UPI003FD55722